MNSLAWGFLSCQAKHCRYAREIAIFLHQHPQRILNHRQLYNILSLFEKWWISVGTFRSKHFEQHVLHYIAQRAYCSDIKDGDYVAKLLVFLYEADNHFGFFLCPERECIASPVGPEGENDHLSQFFLDHAYRQQLLISGKRIADLEVFCRSLWLHPCEMAVITESPGLLHLLLQYGALITDDTVSIRRLRTYSATANILIITMCIIKTIVELFRNDSWNNGSECENVKYRNMVTCGRLIIRASPQMERYMMQQMTIEFPGFSSPEEALCWVSEKALTELKDRIFSPLPLKHACRLKIRKILHNNWQLPFGIVKLPIPNILKRYLNLYFD